jgi:aquaporin Z
MMKKYLTEFIGTFFLVLTFVTCANNQETATMAPLATGAMLFVMCLAGARVSGAHYNPAVTLAMFMRGKIANVEVAPYLFSQVAGGAAAALVGVFIHRSGGGIQIVTNVNQGIPALLVEILGTFVLCYAALSILEARDEADTKSYAAATGVAYMACGYALGKLSGGAFNPAVAIGITTAGMKTWLDIWIYLLGAFGGAAIASTVLGIESR